MTEILGHSSQRPIGFCCCLQNEGQFYWSYLLVQYDGESLFSEELLGISNAHLWVCLMAFLESLLQREDL